MSRDGHITESGKPAGGKAGKPPKKSREWFERKVSELGEALNRLPQDRRQQFSREVSDLGAAAGGPAIDQAGGKSGKGDGGHQKA